MIGNWVLLDFRGILLRDTSISGERNEKQDTGNGFFLICLTLSPNLLWEKESHQQAAAQSEVKFKFWSPVNPYKECFGLKFGPTQHINLSPRRQGLCTRPRYASITQMAVSMSTLPESLSSPLSSPLHSPGPWFLPLTWSPFFQSSISTGQSALFLNHKSA